MSDWADTYDQMGADPVEPAVDDAAPQLYFGSVDEFVREFLIYHYRRRIGGTGSGRVWSAEWWRSEEAISRLESLWRAWEYLRLDPATGMSTWWRDHADHHMPILMDPEGPFAGSEDSCRRGEPLPYAAPPLGLFPDIR